MLLDVDQTPPASLRMRLAQTRRRGKLRSRHGRCRLSVPHKVETRLARPGFRRLSSG